MNGSHAILNHIDRSDELRQQLRDVGVVLVAVDENGSLRWPIGDDNDWLTRLLTGGRMLRMALERLAADWVTTESTGAIEAFPGMWFVPVPLRVRREQCGFLVGIVATTAFVEDEVLCALAQARQYDLIWCRRQLQRVPVVPEDEAARAIAFVRMTIQSHVDRAGDLDAVETLSTQLTESYEEISLLYTIADQLTQIDRADRFMRRVCDELIGTLPYEWVGALFANDLSRCTSLAGQIIVAGNRPTDMPTMRSLLTTLLHEAAGDRTRIIDPTYRRSDADFAVLGQPVIAHPIGSESGVVGILTAGGRTLDEDRATTVDLKLIEATARQTGVYLQNAALFEDLNRMFVGTLEALTSAIDAKDPYTCGHSQRVAYLTAKLARAINLDDASVSRFRIAGLVHDVGKIGVPEAVLTKPGRLTDAEFGLVKLHPEIGHRILRDIPKLNDVLPGVLHHHERWDGRGYPHGLAGENIPLVARVIGLADAFDAMSSTRTYRSSLSRDTVIDEIRHNAGKQFDPNLVAHFLDLSFDEYDTMLAANRDEFRATLDGGAA